MSCISKHNLRKKVTVLLTVILMVFGSGVPALPSLLSLTTAQADTTYTPTALHVSGKTMTKTQVSQLLSVCKDKKVLPSYAFAQAWGETQFGTANSAGKADNNWAGVKVPGFNSVKPAPTRGTPATDDGGYYAHYTSLTEFFKDWIGGVADNKSTKYHVAGKTKLKDAVYALFMHDQGGGDYAGCNVPQYKGASAVRAKKYFALVNASYQTVNNANNKALDKMDKAFVDGKILSGSLDTKEDKTENAEETVKTAEQIDADDTFSVNAYGSYNQKVWDQGLQATKKYLENQDPEKDFTSKQKQDMQDWVDDYNTWSNTGAVTFIRNGVSIIAFLVVLYSLVLVIAFAIDRLGVLDFSAVSMVTSNRLETGYSPDDSTFLTKGMSRDETKVVVTKDIAIIVLLCALVFALVVTGKLFEWSYKLYLWSTEIIQWGNQFH